MTQYQQQQADLTESIRHLLATTTMSYLAIATQLDCAPQTVYVNAKKVGLRRQADKEANNG